MLWRISAALVALYIVHGSENTARDSARLASEIGQQVPQAVVAACVDKPEVCQQLLRHVSGPTGASTSAPAVPPSAARPAEPALAGIKAPPVPVVSGEFPLPPVRPTSMSARKGA